MRPTRGLVYFFCAAPLAAQQGVPDPGVNRERMWYAPAAADWVKPCLVPWQRTWEDAVAVARETGRPILICVNMDGEIASEHYAGVRYRQPEIAALYEPYVCVVASVYRHTPRDYDDQGRRIACPRFGTVTCSEHVWIEPFLYERYFEGQRVAPRHIMIELEGGEQYDVFYAWDTDSVFGAIREGIAQRPPPPPRPERGDRSLAERVASRDARDREVVERAYAAGDRELQSALLDAAAAQGAAAPVDLLRQAVFGLDLELGKKALQALAQAEAPAAVDLIAEALRAPLQDSEQDALIRALERHGAASPRARTLAVVHRGLAGRASEVDVEAWRGALGDAPSEGAGGSGGDYSAAAAELERSTAAAATRPADPAAALTMAESALAFAIAPEGPPRGLTGRAAASRLERLRFADALAAIREAESLGASGWRVDAAAALASWYLGDLAFAYARAEMAVRALPPGESGWNAMAVLGLFAEARRAAIAQALREKSDWPPQWLTDVHAAYAVLARHPLGEAGHAVAHHDFLISLNAHGPAERVLKDALRRFPESWDLHDRWRNRLLADRGVAALEPAYAAWLGEPDAPACLRWYAGVASFVTAEVQRRAREPQSAVGAYERAAIHFERAIAADARNRDSADHYAALSLAGRARVALEGGDLDLATAQLLAAFARRPASAASLDGLNLSPADTARALRARLLRDERADLLAMLDAALEQVDPALLGLPAYERPVPER